MYLLLLGTTALSLVITFFCLILLALAVRYTSLTFLFIVAGNNSSHFQTNSCGNAPWHPYALVPLGKQYAE